MDSQNVISDWDVHAVGWGALVTPVKAIRMRVGFKIKFLAKMCHSIAFWMLRSRHPNLFNELCNFFYKMHSDSILLGVKMYQHLTCSICYCSVLSIFWKFRLTLLTDSFTIVMTQISLRERGWRVAISQADTPHAKTHNLLNVPFDYNYFHKNIKIPLTVVIWNRLISFKSTFLNIKMC